MNVGKEGRSHGVVTGADTSFRILSVQSPLGARKGYYHLAGFSMNCTYCQSDRGVIGSIKYFREKTKISIQKIGIIFPACHNCFARRYMGRIEKKHLRASSILKSKAATFLQRAKTKRKVHLHTLLEKAEMLKSLWRDFDVLMNEIQNDLNRASHLENGAKKSHAISISCEVKMLNSIHECLIEASSCLSESVSLDYASDRKEADKILRKEWFRNSILGSANFKCAMCSKSENLAIDHIKSVVRGGSTTPENLQVLCSSCNSKKGA